MTAGSLRPDQRQPGQADDAAALQSGEDGHGVAAVLLPNRLHNVNSPGFLPWPNCSPNEASQ